MIVIHDNATAHAIIDALEFYADPANWRTTSTGFAVQYDPTPPAANGDAGARARAALDAWHARPK